jgi:hypothetical protein
MPTAESWYFSAMVRFAGFARWLVLVVFAPIFLAVATDMAKRWAERQGWIDHPEEAVGWLMGIPLWIAQLPWVYPVALILGGLTVGIWLDWLLRRFDTSRSDRRVGLGLQLQNLANVIERRQGGFRHDWPDIIQDLRPQLMSIFIRVEKIGLWAPVDQLYDREDGATVLVNYLRMVGTMLADGHFKQARKRALECKTFVELT